MFMKHSIYLFVLFIGTTVFSQEIQITGKITDKESIPLESATIYVEKISDSSMVSYTVSDENGQFQLNEVIQDEKANLFVSFSGFAPYKQTLELKDEIDLGTIVMSIQENTLDEVVITASSPPMTIKKDTVEFNAGSFNTRQNANLEDVMKKLPGVVVDRDGNITINGKPITRIIVNGEEFFGDDPQIALKNLPKEIINKIQITDTKTEAQEFTGESGDSDNKTVNITIKDNKNKGYFARASLGGGTDDRYEMNSIFNYFNDEFRASIIGGSNNINSSGFSYDETFGSMGNTDGGNGITKSENAGVNITNQWDDIWDVEEVEAEGDYFFGRNDTRRSSSSQTQYLLPGSQYQRNSEQEINTLNDSHRANAEFEVEFDTLSRLSIETGFDSNHGISTGSDYSESLAKNGTMINNTSASDNKSTTGLSFDNEIDFIQKFGEGNAFISLEFSNSHKKHKNENFYYSESTFYQEGNERTEIQDQYIDEQGNEDTYSFELRQRSVLFDVFFLDVSYDFDYNHSTNKRYVYDESENTEGLYDNLNELLSNDFELKSRRHAPNIGLEYENNSWEIEADVGILYAQIENFNLFEGTTFKNDYTNFGLNIDVKHEREGKASYEIEYETEAEIPSIRELQPVVDRTDPLHIIEGNPELNRTYSHDIDMEYRIYDYDTRVGISSWASLNFIQNEVVPKSTIDEDLVRYTRYINVDGTMSANAGVSYSKGIKKDDNQFKFRVKLDGSYDKNIGFTNAVKFRAERFSLSPNIRLTYSIEDVLEVNPEYDLEYQSSKYDINPDRNQDFANHRLGMELTSYWPKNMFFANDFSYRYLQNVAPGLENSSILWNLSLGYQFFKDDAAAVQVKVYDLLDQNVETRRVIEDDYIRDTNNLILKRYVMFSLSYKLSNFGGRSNNNS